MNESSAKSRAAAGHGADADTVAPVIEIRDLVATYGERTILDGVSMQVAPGEIRVVLGPSGCGKTTLLKHAIGLLQPSSGSIRLFGQDIVELTEDQMAEILVRIGMLFQGGALIQSMTLLENVMLPLREHTHLDAEAVELTARIKLSIVGLGRFAELYPAEISGGMRKRAALARAIAQDPALLFCDEPTAGLDPVTAAGIDQLIVDLRDALGITVVVISHELTSIRRTADRVTMLHGGLVVADGPLDELVRSHDPRIRSFFTGGAEDDSLDQSALLRDLFMD